MHKGLGAESPKPLLSQRCNILLNRFMNYDVVIIGGGPAGSTVATYLLKFAPDLKVAVFEREKFPRDHVGESQLPFISYVLDEMGVWDKVEAAGFPIKIGATYRWGKQADLWFFNFLGEEFVEDPRPAKFDGHRRNTAMQVDRAKYDDILLRHAESLGAKVFEEASVRKVHREKDRVTGVEVDGHGLITARHYVDASGHVGILRRAMGVQVEYPTNLQNVAFWDYWQNTEWAETIGKSGTRVQVMSLGYGWIWFIPISPTRTSVGFVTPAEYFKKSGMRPEQLYAKALSEEERISELLANATREDKFATTKDWSFVAKRQFGENWILAGESSGFADPILAAGLTITHAAAREVAFTLLELDRGERDAKWLKESYERRLERRIRNHIRFADYWYTANSQFSELKEFTAEIAKDNGLALDPDSAWRWLAQGGFIDEDLFIGNGGIEVSGIRDFAEFLYGASPESVLSQNNVFKLDLQGATWHERAVYADGRVHPDPGYLRGTNLLPIRGVFEFWIDILQRESKLPAIMKLVQQVQAANQNDPAFRKEIMNKSTSALEAMIADGWVEASYDPSLPLAKMEHRRGRHMKVAAKPTAAQ